MDEPKFKGKELIRASKGTDKDILTVLLEPDKLYTEKEVQKLVKDFTKMEVK
ncbi:hypothetical protein Q428_08700 [Fervidicella metallireducens AeB]|uniref:Uncharacterized protein n=1 Tax=Fervidicella metallireducens AeB TaxID=1403537 RepID=A0A017RV15_9CLOT|nr:hypothetical protein [Fervidicella metallireducens]EYE88269.1 hypothetical protein Q428_08700 [Fervidicella metallireducens AeB]